MKREFKKSEKPFKKVLKTCRGILQMRKQDKKNARDELARKRVPVPMALQFPNMYGCVKEVLTLKEKVKRFLSEERARKISVRNVSFYRNPNRK